MCCTWLAGNTGRKNDEKIAICSPSHNFVGLYLRNWGTYRQAEKNLLSSNISSTSLQYGELWPTSGWDRFVSLENPSKFQRVSYLGSVTAQPNFGVEQRAPPAFGRAAITLGIGHISSCWLFLLARTAASQWTRFCELRTRSWWKTDTKCSRTSSNSSRNSARSTHYRRALTTLTPRLMLLLLMTLLLLSGTGAKYCDERVCMSVCLSSITTHTSKRHEIFRTCYQWPWFGPSLTTVQYVMYFRFCGWRHRFT